MSNREIVFIVYASNVEKSVESYSQHLGLTVDFTSPRYVTFALGDGVSLAVWSGESQALSSAPTRTSEVCLNVDKDEVLKVYDNWTATGVDVLEEPHEDVFGTTFVVSDPDGNRVRVAPID